MQSMKWPLVLPCLVAMGYSLTSVFHVDPVKASWSGWTAEDYWVSEVLTLNVDSLGPPGYCELFSGQGGAAGFEVNVYSYPNGISPLATGLVTETRNDVWVRCTLNVAHPESLIKGRRYEFRWSRQDNARIQFYYDYCATKYDSMIVPGEDQPPPGPPRPALAMRCYGQMTPLDSTCWGFNVKTLRDTTAANRLLVAARAETAGVRMNRVDLFWHWVQPDSPGAFDFDSTDALVRYSSDTLHCENLGVLAYATTWTGTHIYGIDSSNVIDWDIGSPPRNLDLGVWDSQNYWARYVEAVVRRYDGVIDVWEAWNETNVLSKYWQVPDSFYPIGADMAKSMCSLYVRLCAVADSVIDSITHGDRLVVGAMSEVDTGSTGGVVRVPGKEWLRLCYELAGSVFWDAVSVHPYHGPPFRPVEFQAGAETLRAIMRDSHDYGDLYITELGWKRENCSEEEQADYLGEMFAALGATEASPGGGYDRAYWYCFLYDGDGAGYWLLDTLCSPKKGIYASGQTQEMLTGKRYNGRVLTGDAGIDTLARILEYEDCDTIAPRKTWVCWKNGGMGGGDVNVGLPVRVDTDSAESLDYNGTQAPYPKTAATDGWLPCTLTTRPVFVTEPENGPIARPDLVVDSVRLDPSLPLVGQQMAATVFLHNRGSRASPARVPVRLTANGRELTRGSTASVAMGGVAAAELAVRRAPAWAEGTVLLAATANPGQSFVELNMEDNTAYIAIAIAGPNDR